MPTGLATARVAAALPATLTTAALAAASPNPSPPADAA